MADFQPGSVHRITLRIRNTSNINADISIDFALRPSGGSGQMNAPGMPPGAEADVFADVAMPWEGTGLRFYVRGFARPVGSGDTGWVEVLAEQAIGESINIITALGLVIISVTWS